MREEIRAKELAPPISHYTDAVRFGDVLYISGIAPVDKENKLVGVDDVVLQTRQVFSNMEKILQAANATFENVIKVTIYLTDISDREKINGIRKEYFKDTRPASTLIGVSELAIPGMRVEIEAIAGLKSTNS